MNHAFTSDLVRTIDFEASPALIDELRSGWQSYSNTVPPYPGNFTGKGIVICAGGIGYLTCAWINIMLLRKYGCKLPVEVWYAGRELNEEAILELKKLGVECRNREDYTGLPIENLALKPFAILNSRFLEVLYLDADNNCVTDPSYLFDDKGYQTYGTMFWPDYWTTASDNPIWKIIGSENYGSSEQESGQLLVNKEKCWRELNLCMYFNLNRDHYYEMLLGDKDTFRFAWLALGTAYNMISTLPGFCGYSEQGKGFYGFTMVQHDPCGNIVFLHRNWLKWDVTRNKEILWTDIKRFKTDARIRKMVYNMVEHGAFKRQYFDIAGDVEQIHFRELFGDYELQCLEILETLRNSEFYARFLLHSYYVYFRPGFAQGVMGILE